MGMMMMPAVWDSGYAVVMFVMWWVMMIAMMLPSAAPMVLLFAAVNRKRLEREAPEALEARVEAILAERPGQGPLLAQQLGSLLGQQLRDAGRAGRVAPRLLRHLFQGSGPAAGAPAAVYAHLARESAPPEPALEVAEP